LLLFSLIITVVLDPAQLTLFLIAVFICISTLRMVIKKNRVNKRVYNRLEVDVDKASSMSDDCICEFYTLWL
jgi:hypothetical protein